MTGTTKETEQMAHIQRLFKANEIDAEGRALLMSTFAQD